MKHLSATMPVSVQIVDSISKISDELPSDPIHLAHESHIFILDSLLLNNFDQTDLSRLKGENGKFFLMVHYLDLIDPKNASSANAQQQKNLLPSFDGFIVTSQYSRNMLVKHGISPDKISVITPGIDPIFRSSHQRQNDGSVKILTVSSLINGKGMIELLSILEDLSDLHWTWQIVGETRLDENFSATFKERIQKSTVRTRIILTGAVDQKKLAENYRQSDIFITPSQFESCSMVTMEAMAASLPILAYAVGGLSELVQVEKNGFLVDNFDRDNFKRALVRLIQDADLRQRFGRMSQTFSRKFPGWEESMDKLKSFLTNFVSSKQLS